MLEMITLLGGGLMRLLPFLVDFFKQRQDADHEYRMTQLQLEIDKARASQQLDLAHVQGQIAADAADQQGLIDALKGQMQPSGVKWADALSASFRPIAAFWWCIVLYSAAKIVHIVVAFQAGASLAEFSSLLMTPFDRQVIGSILGFWFADRAIRKTDGR